jgi:hypothetical protein
MGVRVRTALRYTAERGCAPPKIARLGCPDFLLRRRFQSYLSNQRWTRLGAGRNEPEIRGRLRKFYPYFRSARVTPTKAGYTSASFRPILGILDDKPLAHCHTRCQSDQDSMSVQRRCTRLFLKPLFMSTNYNGQPDR